MPTFRVSAKLGALVALVIALTQMHAGTSSRTYAASSSTQLITNGGFENGQSPWQESTYPSRQLISPLKPRTGSYSAYLCGVNYCNHQLWQTVALPTAFSSLTLTYWYYVSSQETLSYCYDAFHSRIRTAAGSTLLTVQTLCNYNKTSGWVQESANLTSPLTAYKGQHVQVYFQGTTNATNPSSFFVDDVSLVAAISTSTATPTATATATRTSTPSPTPTASTGSGAYLGASISGVPADMTGLTSFEQDAQKHMAIINFWRAMGGSGSILYDSWFQNVFNHNSVPMITWVPRNWDSGSVQTPYTLANIAAGVDDSIINSWAQQLRGYGRTIFIRFAHEMNGTWYPWGGQPQNYVAAWRHIHGIFVADGATNVRWIWCPNTQWSTSSAFDPYYPGDSYTDWVALDSYNKPSNGSWLWFSQLFSIGNSYGDITALTSKRLMIAETSSAEAYQWPTNPGYTKAQWITNAISSGIPSMPRIKALVWMNDNLTASEGCCDWRIESSAAAQSAFAQAVAPSMYLSTWP